MILFEDFELTVDGKPDHYTVAVRGPDGISLAPVPFVLASDDFHSLLELQDGEQLSLDELKEVGAALFDALFSRKVWRAYTGAAERLPVGSGLRLKLNVRVPELAQLPWELLYDEDKAAFLARRRDRPLVRTLDTTVPVEPLVKGRLLHVQASPLDLEPLDIKRSQKVLEEMLGERAEIIPLVKATPRKLREALLDDYHILHYDGHAAFDEATERGVLYLHDEQDDAKPLSAEMLADYLVGTTVRLVVLNACETGVENHRFAGLAQHLMRTSSIPALVAMQFAVEDGAAIAFNRGFYGALAKDQPLEVAMVNGRLAMCEHSDSTDSTDSTDWLAPLLFMRALDGYLFKPDKKVKSALPAPPSARGRQGEGADGRNGDDNGPLSFRPLALAPPLPPYKLVGRDDILGDLKKQLFAGDLALSALNGLPGVGKTALAVALAHDKEVLAHFKDGVLWAGLGREPDVLALLGKWARALGSTPEEIAERTTIEERRALLKAKIGQKQMLLVVDDAWQKQAALYFKFYGNNCAHLVTTRQFAIALDFAGESTTVPELRLDDGLALLKQFAPAAVAAAPEAAQELVKAVGGLPLALILMGRYLREETHTSQPRRLRTALSRLREVEERLFLEQTQEPPGSYPSLPAKTSLSLLAVIEISDEALDKSARRAFYALSVFPPKPNTFSEEAAEAVSAEAVETLDTLTDYGLLESSGEGRYTLHQAIADYAELNRTDEGAYTRMVTFFVNYVETHEREYDALGTETNNVVAALDVAFERNMQRALVQGTNAFYHFLSVRGLYGLAETYLERVEQTARSSNDTSGLVTTLLNLGRTAEKRGNYPQAEEYLQEGLALARKLGHGESISALLTALGAVAGGRGAYDQAKAYYQEGLALARELGHRERICLLLTNLGAVAGDRGAYDQEEEYYQEGLALARELGHREKICLLLMNLGVVASDRGAYDQAEAYFQEGLALARELGHRKRISHLLSNLGAVVKHRGAYDLAKTYLQEGLALAQALGARTRISHLLMNLGEVETERGAYAQAEAYYQEGLELARELGQRWLISAALVEWGKLDFKQHNWDLAAASFRETLEIAQEASIQQFVASALYGLAQVAFVQGNYASARQQGQESLAIFEEIGHGDANEVKEWLATSLFAPKAP